MVKVKCSPAIKDLTVEEEGSNEGDGWEAVLFDGSANDRLSKTAADAETIGLVEKPEDLELLELIRRQQWEDLLARLKQHPHTAYVKFAAQTQQSAGNLILHECCRHGAPCETVESVLDANPDAVMSKGHAGYLPMHHACACAHPSLDVIQLLFSQHANAVCQVDEEEIVLPLHLACKSGASRDVLMVLLSFYPEASKHKDAFGRLPLDYAKGLRNAANRTATVQCLEQAGWLMSAASFARTRTEMEYQRQIRGYEDSQTQRLERIKEIHDLEVAEMESQLQRQKEDLTKQTRMIQSLENAIQAKASNLQNQIDTLETLVKVKDDALKKRDEAVEQEKVKLQVALDLQNAKIQELTQELAETQERHDSLVMQLNERTEDLEAAVEDIDTLNKHADWLESTLGSIRRLANDESPLVHSLHSRDRPLRRDDKLVEERDEVVDEDDDTDEGYEVDEEDKDISVSSQECNRDYKRPHVVYDDQSNNSGSSDGPLFFSKQRERRSYLDNGEDAAFLNDRE